MILALKLVAATRASELSLGIRDALRTALLAERWGDAVAAWIGGIGVAVDVYPSMDLNLPSDVEMADIEMQFMPLDED